MQETQSSHYALLRIFGILYCMLAILSSVLAFSVCVITIPLFNGNYYHSLTTPFNIYEWLWLAYAVGGSLTATILYWLTTYSLFYNRYYNFCFVMAVLTCLLFPLGTFLGIATIVLLLSNKTRVIFSQSRLSQAV